MIPSTWLPHFRGSDGELVGYLDGADPTVIPRTLFGYPLAAAGSRATRSGCSTIAVWPAWATAGCWCATTVSGSRADHVRVRGRVEVVETEYGDTARTALATR